MKPPHLTIARNNIFLGVWEKTLRDTCFTNSCGSPLHFISNLINELYPENSVFSLWNENAKDFGLILSANNTLWENIVLNCWGTCCYDHTNEDEYFSSDIKAGDMFLIEHQNLPSDYIPRISPHLYIGDEYFFNWNMAEQEPIENIKKSIMGAKLKWVLRYNFDRTDTKTPSGAEDILTWENFWGESYVSMNNLSYDKNHRDTSQRELVASIDINGNITTDISPVPTLSDFFKIFLLKDCLVCFKEFDSVENEYTKNEEFLKSYPSTAGEGYYRYNWTLEFDASKYTDMENYLNTNNLQYMVI